MNAATRKNRINADTWDPFNKFKRSGNFWETLTDCSAIYRMPACGTSPIPFHDRRVVDNVVGAGPLAEHHGLRVRLHQQAVEQRHQLVGPDAVVGIYRHRY